MKNVLLVRLAFFIDTSWYLKVFKKHVNLLSLINLEVRRFED
jgi:hypothetical protein